MNGRPAVLAPNLPRREFTLIEPNQAWVADITYICAWQGWLYLAIVLDLFSRRVVGWSMQPMMTRDLVIDALVMAVRMRRPKGRAMVHSDQGSQYGSEDWRRFSAGNRLVPSMSRRGKRWDNAVAETSLSSLKKEWVRRQI